ncbi:outer membrane protein [Tamilnaduibacter salinus]|uniref:Outer membrane protein n=1 Tax=Tamilnaduibacter salinus TaxID=1484056 RepID=A0A2U1CZY3_9GAMM|nr:outer membrane protein [Tamilnaduibacter salinus]
MMRKTAMTVASVLAMTTPLAMADTVGAGASVSYWDSSLSGTATNGTDTVDVENDLNLDGDSNVNLTALVEHPVPVLPNIRLNYTLIEQSGDGQLEANTGFGLITPGTTSVDVRSDLDLEQLDLTLYYELLDNWVNLDGGLTIRDIDGELIVQDQTRNLEDRTDISGVIPMAYASARFDLPFTGASIGAEGNGISFDGDSIFDARAYGQLDIAVLRLQAGYRRMDVDYEDGNDALDVTLDGPYVSAGVDF